MQDEIFSLLMMILMLENGGGTENINQLVLMFLLMNSRGGVNSSNHRLCTDRCFDGRTDCGREDGFTF